MINFVASGNPDKYSYEIPHDTHQVEGTSREE